MVYVTFVIDAYSRRILGWRAARPVRTTLVLDALEHALWTWQPHGVGDLAGLVHHTDAESQYTSIAFTERFAAAGFSGSVGTVGDAYDNAPVESVIGLFKIKLIKHAGPGAPRSRSSSPPWNTPTGSTTGGSIKPAVTFRPQNSRMPTTVKLLPSPRPARQQPEPPDSPGAFS
jgi:transposase InsO family protein